MQENKTNVNKKTLSDAEYCLLANAEIAARQRELQRLKAMMEQHYARIGECLNLLERHGGCTKAEA